MRAAKALGLDGANGFTPEQVLDWLLAKCNTDPETVMATINPGNKARTNATLAFKDFEKYGVIARQKDGAFYFGGVDGINIGHTPDMVIGYLLDPSNAERVKGMLGMLSERTKRKEEV